MSCREGLISPQTEIKASVGFKVGVLTYYALDYETKDTNILISFRVTPRPKILLVHGQQCGPTCLPLLIIIIDDVTTSSPLLEKKINILHM